MQKLDTLQSLSRRPALGMVMAFIPGIFLAESHPSWIVALLLFSFTALALLLALVASFFLTFFFSFEGNLELWPASYGKFFGRLYSKLLRMEGRGEDLPMGKWTDHWAYRRYSPAH